MLKEALRFLRRNRMLSASATLVVALGMGSETIALSVLWAISHQDVTGLKPAGYATVAESSHGGPLRPLSWEMVRSFGFAAPAVPTFAYAEPTTAPLQIAGRSLSIRVSAVSGDFFGRFATPLTAGAALATGAETPSGQNEIVLAFELANRLFGSPSNALGHFVTVHGVALEVAGVAPVGFEGVFGKHADAWVAPHLAVPLYIDAEGFQAGTGVWRKAPVFYVVAAVPHSTNETTAADVLRQIGGRRFPTKLAVHAGLTTDPARDLALRNWARLGLFVALFLASASGLSFGGLLLARAPALLNEVRLKRTLGASSPRLFVELCMGPASVAVAGLAGAILFAEAARLVLQGRSPWFLQHATLSPVSVLAAVLAQAPVALIIAALMGLAPALRLLKDSGAPRASYAATGSPQSARLMNVIVGAQILCCISACIVAVTIVRCALEAGRQPLGYEPEGRTVLVAGVRPGSHFSFHTDSRGDFPMASVLGRVLRRVAAVPGVTGAALALAAPLDSPAKSMRLADPAAKTDDVWNITCNGVSKSYFETVGTPLVAGRAFSSDDANGDPTEAIINRTLEHQIWPSGSALGRRVRLEHPTSGLTVFVTIVGVAADQRSAGPKESAQPTLFLPLRGNIFSLSMPAYLIVNTHQPVFGIEAVVNQELAAGLPGLGVTYNYRISDRLRSLVEDEQRRVQFAIIGAAIIALVSYLGLYSALAYFVATRRRELAIRMCCGATPASVGGRIVRRALSSGMVAATISICSWGVLRRMVSGGWMGAGSWSSVAASIVTLSCLLAVAAVSFVPALRASRIAPVEGLRDTTEG